MGFSSDDVDIQARKAVYQGFFQMEEVTLRHRMFDGDWSQPITRELFRRDNAVGVFLHDPENRLIGLVEQFRVGALEESSGPWLYELVAGMVKPGESPEQVARRELREEAGITDCQLEFMCEYLSSPGGCDEKLYLYYGKTDLSGRSGRYGLQGEHEDIFLHVMPESEAFAVFETGRFNTAAATIAFLWLQRRLEGRKQVAEAL